MLIADNYAVERAPSEIGSGRRANLPLHELCLFKLGIHLGEIWWLGDLNDYMRKAGRSPLPADRAAAAPARRRRLAHNTGRNRLSDRIIRTSIGRRDKVP